jgi:hypothetical protein
MLQALVMSLGAIYAFIPIVIIIILIAAAAGLSRGTDLFQIFGIGALIGVGSGIGGGGTGKSIKGFGKSYGSTKAFSKMGGAAGGTIKGAGNKDFEAKMAARRAKIINNFEDAAATGKLGGTNLSNGEKAALAAAAIAVSGKAKTHEAATGKVVSAESILSQHVNMAVVPGAMAPKSHGFIYGRDASKNNPKAFSTQAVGSFVSEKKKYDVGSFSTWLYGGKKVTSGNAPRTIISLGPAASIYGASTSVMSRFSKDRLSRAADPDAFGSARWGRVRQEALQKKLEREGKPLQKNVDTAEKEANITQKSYHDAIVKELKNTPEGREVLRKIKLVSNENYNFHAGMPVPALKGTYTMADTKSGFKSYYFKVGKKMKSKLTS